MCLGIPGQIVSISEEHPDFARVDVSGALRDINIGLLDGEPVKLGDWILIHLGFALERMNETEARAAHRALVDLA